MHGLTIYGVVSDSVADSLDDPLPANILYVLCVRNDEADVAVVLLVVPAVEVVADTDVLRVIRSPEFRGDGNCAHDVGIVGGKEAFVVRVPEVAPVRDGDFLGMVSRSHWLYSKCEPTSPGSQGPGACECEASVNERRF